MDVPVEQFWKDFTFEPVAKKRYDRDLSAWCAVTFVGLGSFAVGTYCEMTQSYQETGNVADVIAVGAGIVGALSFLKVLHSSFRYASVETRRYEYEREASEVMAQSPDWEDIAAALDIIYRNETKDTD